MSEALKQEHPPIEDEQEPAATAEVAPAESKAIHSELDARDVIDRIVALREEKKELGERLDKLESELREFAISESKERLTGSTHTVKITPTVSSSLPSSGSKEREELEAQIRDLGVWDRCSNLNASKIGKVAEDTSISEAERALLTQRLTTKKSSRMTFSKLK